MMDKKSILAVILVVIVIAVSMILQTTVFRALDFGGIAPNLMIILTASTAFIKGDKPGLLVGFFSGLSAAVVLI